MLALTLSAELNGVTDLVPTDTQEQPFYYMFKVQCTSCRETHPNWVGVSRFEKHPQPGSRGEANFVWKCRLCNRTHSASITDGPTPYTLPPASPSSPLAKQRKQTILTMDCRGLEFTAFDPAQGDGVWEAKGVESGSNFKGVELRKEGSDGGEEWYDYDEKAGGEVWIKECAWSIDRA